MNHVIEHLHDPVGNLRICAQVLKPGGQLSITTPNLASRGHKVFGPDCLHLDTPRHLVLFTPDSLRKVLETLGFQAQPDPHLEPNAAEVFEKSMHIRFGSDPIKRKPPLPIHARLRAIWLVQKANRAARADPHLAESVILIAIRN
jgi:hypothetical protein